MGQTSSACKPCSSSDPTSDTVRVDAGAIAEDASPTTSPVLPAEHEKAEEAEREAERESELEAEEAARRAAQEQEQRLEAERRAAEEAERLEEEQEQRRLQAEEEERKQRIEQQRLEEEQAALERQKQKELEEKKVKEAHEKQAAAAKEQAECQQKVDVYLKGRGFKSVTHSRKAFCGAAVLPLHLAIEEGDADTVRALLRCGADVSQKNAQGKTAREVAERCNKAGSHELVLAALTTRSASQGGA